MLRLCRRLALVAFTLSVPALASASLARTGEASATFLAVGPAGLEIEGKTSELEVAEADGKIEVAVPLANLDTGIALRNKHMREKYLEVARFPPSKENAGRVHRALASFGAPLTDLTEDDLAVTGTTFQIGVAPNRIDVLTSIEAIEFEPAYARAARST